MNGNIISGWGLLAAGVLLLTAIACGPGAPPGPCADGVDCEPRGLSSTSITPASSFVAAGSDFSIETASLEEILEKGYLASEQSPVHIAVRARALQGTLRCDWSGIARAAGQREEAIRFWLGIDDDTPLPSAEEVERRFMLYVNDMEPRFRLAWEANVSAMVGGGLSTEYVFLTCYADYTVNEYLVGAGDRHPCHRIRHWHTDAVLPPV